MKKHSIILFFVLLATAFQVAADNDPLVSLFRFQSQMAASGNGLAMYKLGEMYEKGEGTKQDYFKAREMYRKAEQAGVPHAKEAISRVDDRIANRNRNGQQKQAEKQRQQEKARKEAARKEAARKEAARKEAARREAARKEAARREAARREAARREAARREAARREAARKEAARREAARREAARREAAGKKSSPRTNQATASQRPSSSTRTDAYDTADEEQDSHEAVEKDKHKDKGFKSDVCNTPAARFISSCKNK